MKGRRLGMIVAWVAGLAAAAALDRPIATWVHESGLGVALKARWHWLLWGVRRLGDIRSFTLVAAGWLFILGRRWWGAAAYVAICGVLVASNALVKWMIGRARPFQGGMFVAHPFVGGLHGLGGANQSFPSGDVCLAAATGTSLALLFPRWRWVWAAAVVLVAVERVAEGAHYPSDVTAGAFLGWGLAMGAWHVPRRPIGPPRADGGLI